MMPLFQYALKPVKECLFPLGDSGQKNVAWFWLTDSAYCIDLGTVRLFENSRAWQEKHGFPPEASGWDEYPYIRQLEDLFDILPEIATPVPDWAWELVCTPEKRLALKKQLDSWYEKLDAPSDEEWELYRNMTRLIWDNNRLDTGYLRFRSFCWFCRTGEQLVIQYDFRDRDDDGLPVWSASSGSYEISYGHFIQEVENLLHRFFPDMERQVENAITLLTGSEYLFYPAMTDKKTGLPVNGHEHLRVEQAERRRFFTRCLEKAGKETDNIDWHLLKQQFDQWITYLPEFNSPA